MDDIRTKIWASIGKLSQADLTKKQWLFTACSSVCACISNTRDPQKSHVEILEGERGITIADDLAHSEVAPFLRRWGISDDAEWWYFGNHRWEFQTEIDAIANKNKTSTGRKSHVYFILNEARNCIKIGISRTPEQRLRYLQTSSADPLTCLGFIPGARDEERKLHEQFASFKQSGEWFEYADEMRQMVEDLLEQNTDS